MSIDHIMIRLGFSGLMNLIKPRNTRDDLHPPPTNKIEGACLPAYLIILMGLRSSFYEAVNVFILFGIDLFPLANFNTAS